MLHVVDDRTCNVEKIRVDRHASLRQVVEHVGFERVLIAKPDGLVRALCSLRAVLLLESKHAMLRKRGRASGARTPGCQRDPRRTAGIGKAFRMRSHTSASFEPAVRPWMLPYMPSCTSPEMPALPPEASGGV
eukprot:CAMPEP_0115868166 /NCGR_PEP_ID=MMETSP0287-20121206/21151_1 /TAXON_ID=412157 /ORGANISM="Chrysochromulina rotalis, Strain UIO044" /LENGTH=132 /DNA_ID=CAMNT_0003322809 /DNA_START=214 /DNA_END=612 /DNA_ORIENTATION=-